MYLAGQLTTQLCHSVLDTKLSDRSFVSASVSIVRSVRSVIFLVYVTNKIIFNIFCLYGVLQQSKQGHKLHYSCIFQDN